MAKRDDMKKALDLSEYIRKKLAEPSGKENTAPREEFSPESTAEIVIDLLVHEFQSSYDRLPRLSDFRVVPLSELSLADPSVSYINQGVSSKPSGSSPGGEQQQV